jgi:hypothetical protein
MSLCLIGGSSVDGKALLGARTSGARVVGRVPGDGTLPGSAPARFVCVFVPTSWLVTTWPRTTELPLELELSDDDRSSKVTSPPERRTGVVLVRLRGSGTEGGRARVGMSRRLDGIGRAIEERAIMDAIVSRPPSCRLTCREAALLLRDRTWPPPAV